ncbi:MAG: aldehyde dehydrogenase (NADP(+)) [Terracidiphilus sp.]|nr:aldehyde dehydrogenase (NADP(+)) [Terracidiphilus sp.]
MALTGQSFLGGQRGALGGAPIQAINPATGERLDPVYASVSAAEADHAVQLAAQAFPVYAATSGKAKGALLRGIAAGLDAIQPQLAERAHLETALPLPRLLGEVSRTTGQLRLFASLVEEGSWVEARIDPALPERKPLARPGLRSMLRPLGPVVVFGASNFPLAFSAAGGDTASALAAGCPVIIKAHSAHPGTSELVATAIQQAVADAGLPEGVFSLIYGSGVETGGALVRHPLVQAVTFTGSLSAGRTLMDMAAARPRPIPCFTEMSSGNPVFILPGALKSGTDAVAQGLFNSFTLGAGQFCTKPGIVLIPEQPETAAFLAKLSELVDQAQPFTLLTPAIARDYARDSSRRATQAAVAAHAPAGDATPACPARAQIFATDLDEFLRTPELAEEIFGPDTLLVRCESPAEYLRAAHALDGHLTATLLGSEEDLAAHRELIAILAEKAGRLIFNGFPTGVEVSHAMVHGGPYPATADARFTSVGTRSIHRFARPVCFQNFPDPLVPAELQAANPLGILRLVDGVPSREPVSL